MDATLNYQKKGQTKQIQETKQTQPKLTFSQWVLKTIKIHKKRTSTDSTLGLIITVALFLITLV